MKTDVDSKEFLFTTSSDGYVHIWSIDIYADQLQEEGIHIQMG